MNGLRICTPELVRWGVDTEHVDQMCDLIAEALTATDPGNMAPRVREWRQVFNKLHYIT